MNPGFYFRACVIIIVIFQIRSHFGASDLMAATWNQFRGPSGQGISTAKSLPTHWSENENIKWKTPIHDRGWSSPIIVNDKVWLTTANESGHKLYIISINLKTGAMIHDNLAFTVTDPQFAHKFNSYASPTPVSDEDRIYVTFGSPGTICIDSETGETIWQRRDIECDHFRGAGSSPILYKNVLIMNFDGSDHQFVIALDKRSGQTKWKAKRSIDFKDLGPDGKPEAGGDWRKGFSTPHVAYFNNIPHLLSIGSKALYAYNPISGVELWRTESRVGHSASTRPTVTDDMIYYCTGFSKGEIWAVRPRGEGNVTDTHVAWTFKRSVSNKPSLTWKSNRIFMIHDGGVATCLDSTTGKTIWQERIGGNYSASPLLWNDLIYFFSEEGKTTIIKAADTFEIVTTNHLDSGFMASPAVTEESLILRTKTHLLKISNR